MKPRTPRRGHLRYPEHRLRQIAKKLQHDVVDLTAYIEANDDALSDLFVASPGIEANHQQRTARLREIEAACTQFTDLLERVADQFRRDLELR